MACVNAPADKVVLVTSLVSFAVDTSISVLIGDTLGWRNLLIGASQTLAEYVGGLVLVNLVDVESTMLKTLLTLLVGFIVDLTSITLQSGRLSWHELLLAVLSGMLEFSLTMSVLGALGWCAGAGDA